MGRQRLSAPFCIFTLIGGDEKQSVMKAASLSNRRYLETRSLYVIPKQTDNFARPFRHWHEKEGPIEMTSYAEPSHRITGQSFTMLIKLHQTTQCKVFNTLINDHDWPPPFTLSAFLSVFLFFRLLMCIKDDLLFDICSTYWYMFQSMTY